MLVLKYWVSFPFKKTAHWWYYKMFFPRSWNSKLGSGSNYLSFEKQDEASWARLIIDGLPLSNDYSRINLMLKNVLVLLIVLNKAPCCFCLLMNNFNKHLRHAGSWRGTECLCKDFLIIMLHLSIPVNEGISKHFASLCSFI